MSRINTFSTDSWEDVVVKEKRSPKFSWKEEVSVIEIETNAEGVEMRKGNEQVQCIN